MSNPRRVVSLLAIVLVVALPLGACGGGGGSSPTAPTASVPYAQADLHVGDGTEAVAGKQLTVNYTGWLYDATQTDQKGRQFDTSIGRGPFSFRLGVGAVIAGWDRGVVGMKVGGTRRLVIPPALGYGAVSVGSIPANSTLVFEVELISVTD